RRRRVVGGSRPAQRGSGGPALPGDPPRGREAPADRGRPDGPGAHGRRGGKPAGPRDRHRRSGVRLRALESAGIRGEHPPVRPHRHRGGRRIRADGGAGVIANIDWVTWILMIARVVVIFVGFLVSVMLVIWLE